MKTIENYPNYAITEDGQVWSKPRIDRRGVHHAGRWLKIHHLDNYVYVMLYKDNKIKYVAVSKLVLEAFVGPCPKGIGCRHIDGDILNNRLSNLRWSVQSDNVMRCRHRIEKCKKPYWLSKLTRQDCHMIIQQHRAGTSTYQELADKHGVTITTIGDIINSGGKHE